jgi:hypothetical protein
VDGVRKPVGDQPPEVYWRRRILVLGVVALIGVVIWYLVTSPRGTDEPSSPDVTTSPTVSPTVTTSLSPGAGLDAARPCDDADVTITANPNPGTFPAGSLPVFDVSISMDGVSPCKLTVTQENSELLITSGNDRVYSSLDCPNDATINEREFILQADSPDEMFQVTWNRQRSAPGCATVTTTPGAGYYWAAITVQGIASEPVQFVLE